MRDPDENKLISESLRELVRTPHLVRQALKSYNKLPDEDVIEKFQNGDLVAFDVIVARYKEQLINYIITFLNDRHDAEDVVQDTFVKVYKYKQLYKKTAKFSTWIYTVAGNLARSELRKRKRQPSPLSKIGNGAKEFEAVESRMNSDELMDTGVRKKLVKKAIASLPEKFRQILHLKEVDNFTYEQIAKRLNVPVGTVRSRIHRAKPLLQAKLRHLKD